MTAKRKRAAKRPKQKPEATSEPSSEVTSASASLDDYTPPPAPTGPDSSPAPTAASTPTPPPSPTDKPKSSTPSSAPSTPRKTKTKRARKPAAETNPPAWTGDCPEPPPIHGTLGTDGEDFRAWAAAHASDDLFRELYASRKERFNRLGPIEGRPSTDPKSAFAKRIQAL